MKLSDFRNLDRNNVGAWPDGTSAEVSSAEVVIDVMVPISSSLKYTQKDRRRTDTGSAPGRCGPSRGQLPIAGRRGHLRTTPEVAQCFPPPDHLGVGAISAAQRRRAIA